MGFYPTLHRGYRRFGLNERAGDTYGMDPGTVYSQSLYMWYRASDLPLSHSQKVLSWQGFTGNVYTSQSAFILTQVAGTAPSFITASFGSDMGGVYYNGTSMYMQFSARQPITPGMLNYTVIWFGRWTTTGGYQCLWQDPFSTGHGTYIYNSGSLYMYTGNTGYWFLNSTGSQTRMLALVINNGTAFVYDNGEPCTLWQGTTTCTSQYLQLIGSYSSNLFTGYLGEFIVINAILTQAQLKELHDNYFKTKYRYDPTFI